MVFRWSSSFRKASCSSRSFSLANSYLDQKWHEEVMEQKVNVDLWRWNLALNKAWNISYTISIIMWISCGYFIDRQILYANNLCTISFKKRLTESLKAWKVLSWRDIWVELEPFFPAFLKNISKIHPSGSQTWILWDERKRHDEEKHVSLI